jgi:hypothetical protein
MTFVSSAHLPAVPHKMQVIGSVAKNAAVER